MADVKIELNSAGVRALLRSQEMRALCEGYASAIARRCGEGFESRSYLEQTRAVAEVSAQTFKARRENAQNNTILVKLTSLQG